MRHVQVDERLRITNGARNSTSETIVCEREVGESLQWAEVRGERGDDRVV